MKPKTAIIIGLIIVGLVVGGIVYSRNKQKITEKTSEDNSPNIMSNKRAGSTQAIMIKDFVPEVGVALKSGKTINGKLNGTSFEYKSGIASKYDESGKPIYETISIPQGYYKLVDNSGNRY
jgi:hypothetical protein